MWVRRLLDVLSRAARALPQHPDRVFWTRAAHFGDVPKGARVHIAGVAREAERPLTSPVMQQPCVAFRLVVEEPAWRPVLELTGCIPFLVQDGDVAVRIDGPFRMLLQADFEWDFGNDVQRRIAGLIEAEQVARPKRPPPFEEWSWARRRAPWWDRDQASLNRASLNRASLNRASLNRSSEDIASQNYRYFEALVRPGDRVAVEGFASLTVDPSGDRAALREPPLLHAVTGTQDHPVVIAFPEPGSVDR